ncbi:hypothetical protein [Geodermatophilus sp. CPCC 205761]|uniref:hypothetical protein n=1 Tax=Geodermatophilus sp. CPCC 205761 TaxID=2936597 RepID=UPI003EECC06A
MIDVVGSVVAAAGAAQVAGSLVPHCGGLCGREVGMTPEQQEGSEAAYDRVCESYQAIDDFRMKLLGLLPIATGTGVFFLLNDHVPDLGAEAPSDGSEPLAQVLPVIGAIGAVFTLGLFSYELFGIKKCHYLIRAGQRLEVHLGVRGQFRNRPRSLMGFVNEPFASALIYPASMAAWVFLVVAFQPPPWRWGFPVAVFVVGFVLTILLAEGIKRRDLRDFLAELIHHVDGHPTATVEGMSGDLDAEDEMIRRALAKISTAASGSDPPKNLFRRIQAFYCRTCLRVLEHLDPQERPATVRVDDTAEVAFANVPHADEPHADEAHADEPHENEPKKTLEWVTVIDADRSRPGSNSRWRCRDHPDWQEVAGTLEKAVLAEEAQRRRPREVRDLMASAAPHHALNPRVG